MIIVHCRTNLDDYGREKWPKKMSCRPMIGDSVQSLTRRELKVVGITHTMTTDSRYGDSPVPMLIVELHH